MTYKKEEAEEALFNYYWKWHGETSQPGSPGKHKRLRERGEGAKWGQVKGAILEQVVASKDVVQQGGRSGVKVYDSCCGAGSLALAAIRGRLKHTTSEKILVLAGDIDPLCAAMTALQIHANQSFHLLPLGAVKVTVGNELVGERRPGYWSHSCNYE